MRLIFTKALIVSLLLLLPNAGLAGEDYRQKVKAFSKSGDWPGLRGYLIAHPKLLGTGLKDAEVLQAFLDETASLYTALTFTPDAFPILTSVQVMDEVSRPQPRLSGLTNIVDAVKVVDPKPQKAQAIKHKPRPAKPPIQVGVEEDASSKLAKWRMRWARIHDGGRD